MNEQWLNWAQELQFIAQAGLEYSKDKFDIERFNRIRDISAEMIEYKTEIPLDKVKDLFCNETGFQTPKIDTRAAIFKNDKILLVKESDGRWSLPGGWCDTLESVKSNTEKEALEEAGVTVNATKIIAVQDRKKHNLPVYAYNICKIFMLCDLLGGNFKENIETTESNFFSLNDLPELSEEKNTKSQIAMCFDAYKSINWQPLFD